ncbi:shikimate transporter [Streptomyces montanus]|uniref:Putative proline/betaine transporter n=1 Tax=Streptomyces montanus TaxID=2580423 RepID=A0A5R9FJ36_9ACTN|nr:shikimate transporter [Streptomyces montanus]
MEVAVRRASRSGPGIGAAVASFIGAVADWYDFFLYGIVAGLLFSELFFPDVSPAVATLAAWSTFGVGFLFRPLGGIVFGHFGDRLGRKKMLIVTMLIMGVASTLIGVLPTYAEVGIWAPVLLVILRAAQGFAVGGEWGGAALMAVENAPRKWRSLYSSGVQIGASVGLLLATAAVKFLYDRLPEEEFRDWGWRVPFLASAAIVIIGTIVRATVAESPAFVEHTAARPHPQRRRLPLLAAIKAHPSGFLTIIGLRFVELLTFYCVTAFGLSHAAEQYGLNRDALLDINLMVGALAIVTIPVYAYLADRYTRRSVYLWGAGIGVLGALPFFVALQSGSMILIAVTAILLVNGAHDMAVAVQQSLFSDMFGPEFRYSGAGVGYQLASVVGGGFTPLIASALVLWAGGGWALVAMYLLIGCGISFTVALNLHSGHPNDISVPGPQPAQRG